MRTPLIAGNWKMNTSRSEAGVLAGAVKAGVEHMDKIEVVMCPPTVWLAEIAHHYVAPGQFEHLHLGGQNLYFEEKGTFTGETSPSQIKEVADYVLVGHSERVKLFGENHEIVAQKLHAAFAHDLKPILCIGEEVRSDTSLRAMVHTLDHLVKGLTHEELEQVVVAYEPVWAISQAGVGTPASPEYAQQVIHTLRGRLTPKTRLLYGGSSNDQNAQSFLEQPDIDGLLAGNASLTAAKFLGMCQVAEDMAQK
jgi:triosephosphate isomerase